MQFTLSSFVGEFVALFLKFRQQFIDRLSQSFDDT